MTKILVLRYENTTIRIYGNPKLIDYLVSWITVRNYNSQRYPEEDADVFEFDNSHNFMACKLKAIKLGLLQVTKKS